MADQDTTPPILSSFVLPKTVNVIKGDQLVSFTAEAQDQGSGVDSVLLVLDHAFHSNGHAVNYLYFGDPADPFADGTSQLSEQIDSSTGSGKYKVVSATVTDKAGNRTYYDVSGLKQLGINTQFTVKSTAAMDVTAPALTSLGLPKTINVSKHDQTVTFTAGATDQGSGVDHVTLQLDHAIQSNGFATQDLLFYNSTESFSDGQSSLTQRIDATTSPGTYTVAYAFVADLDGNTTTYDTAQLAGMGIDTHFNVKSQASADTVAPVLTALSLPKTVNVTKGDQAVAFTAGATDQGLGVASVQIHLDHAIRSAGYTTSYLVLDGSTGDSFADGKSTMSRMIDHDTSAGVYTIDELFVTDKAGNATVYSYDQLAEMRVDTRFTVRNAHQTASLAGDELLAASHAGEPFPGAATHGWHLPSDGSIIHVA